MGNNHASLMVLLGAGIAGAMMLINSDKKQRERERNAFDKIDASNLTPRQIWDKALEFGRKERLDLHAELDRANKVLDRANEMCEVNEGLHKCTIMVADKTVPETVKDSILEHWMVRFFECFGMNSKATIEAIFSDQKVVERIGQLAAAQQQYEEWLESIRKPAEQKGDGKVHCSFCGKSNKEMEFIIAGPNVHICTECVDLCTDIIKEQRERIPKT